MSDELENTFVNENDGIVKRPQLLKIACILSFIGCGLLIGLMPVSMYFNSEEKVAERIEMLRDSAPSMAQQIEDDYNAQKDTVWYKIQYYVIMFYELLVLLAVVMMYNMKRFGFYLYLALELLPYLSFLFSKGSKIEIGDGGQAAMIVFVVLMVLFDAAFIVMYGMNLKHMKK